MATFKLIRKLTLDSVALPAYQARTATWSMPDHLAMLAFFIVKVPLNIFIGRPLPEHPFAPSFPIRIQRRPAAIPPAAGTRLKRWRQMRIKEGP